MDFSLSYKKCLFAQVLIGIVAFSIAQQNPALLLVAGTIAALSWYVTEGPHAISLPSWAVSILAILSLAWPLLDMRKDMSYLGLAAGHFLMSLQIIMLYARRTNRENSTLIMLSLLLVIDGAVINSSMLFAIFVVIYAFVALPTLLLFHLQITRDDIQEENKRASSEPENVGPPAAVRGSRHRLQFRMIALGVGGVCAVSAALIFVLFPRWTPSTVALKITGQFERSRTGYSEAMHLGPRAPLPGRSNVVMKFTVSKNGKNIGSPTKTWKVRGTSLAAYNQRRHVWRPSFVPSDTSKAFEISGKTKVPSAKPKGVANLNATITVLEPFNNRMFSVIPNYQGMSRLTGLRGYNINKVIYNQINADLSSNGKLRPLTQYTVSTPSGVGKLSKKDAQMHYTEKTYHLRPMDMSWFLYQGDYKGKGKGKHKQRRTYKYASGWHIDQKRIKRLDLKILAGAGIKHKKLNFKNSALDLRISRVLAGYLREHFKYTLDNPPTSPSQKPIINFLFRDKSGHCELFAAGLAAMARSLGMRARVVMGYLATEYNSYGGYYVVRQRDAHAWTEIYCGHQYGWLSFDSTPPAPVAAQHARASHWYTPMRQFYDYLSFKWSATIAHYNAAAREGLLAHLGGGDRNAQDSWTQDLLDWINGELGRWKLSALDYFIIAITFALLLSGMVVLIRIMVIRRKKMATLQLTNLSRVQRWKMGRRLRFFLTVMDMLERHGYKRPVWQSPFSFAQELADANPGRFDPVLSLTEIFYEIRFGHRELDHKRRQIIRIHIKHLEEVLQ